MGIMKKPHISKTGKSVLAFRRQNAAGKTLAVQREARNAQNGIKTPAVPIDLVSDPSRVYGK